ncbi:SDR family oxidoreductase [Jongsikchunia kroppenstedtii]|uniref:SDR family oxidoreductase n=1 Tax=Jongsikchunia kroppenstedtii TaxID=1121721 RepID=UPI003F869AF8
MNLFGRGTATRIDGKVVAITGAARGIGFATATTLFDAGATVAIGDIDADAVGKAAADLGITGIALDVTDRDSFRAFLDQIEAAHGPIDVLINNAGIMPTGPLLEHSDRLIERTVQIDLLGPIIGSKLAAARMVERGRGHIINVASIAGRLPAPGLSVYNAAKFGVIGFSEALNAELEPSGVRVSTIQPSHTATGLIDGLSTSSIPVATPEQVADCMLRVINTGALHGYPSHGLGALAVVGAIPGPVKRRMLKSKQYAEMFLTADADKRHDYQDRMDHS